MHPAIASETLKRPKEEEISPKENLLKKRKTEISACLGRLSSISGLSKEQFSENILSQLGSINSLFQMLQEATTSSPELSKNIQKSRFDIKIIQKRLSEAEHTDETEKKELLQRIDTLLISLKSSENQLKPTSSVTINLPPKLLSLLPLEKSCLHWLWESNHISIKIPEVEKSLKGDLNEALTRSQLMSVASFVLKADIKNLKKSPEVIELAFSKELEKIVDDTLLVMILNEVTSLSDWLQVINHFDFSCCPNLSIETPKILLASCPNLRPDSFQPLASQRFHDHTLLVEGEEIHVNKKFISHFSPYFKALFESGFKEGVDVKNGTPITILSDCTYQSTKDCIDALIGVYNPAEEKNLDRAIAFLLEADKLNIVSFLKIGESTIVAILDSLPSHRITEEALCRVNKEFYLHFANKRFLFLFKKLSELAKPIYEDLWQQFYEKLPPLSEERREEEKKS